NTQAFKTRVFAKAAWTPNGNNSGNGRVVQLTTDIHGADANIGTPDSNLRLRCIASAGQGVVLGAEQFELIGSSRSWPWLDFGIGANGNAYSPDWGRGIEEFSSRQRQARPSEGTAVLTSMHGQSPLNGLRNGGFEAEASGSGDGRFTGMLIEAG